jgi:hypothetical protein
MRRYIRCLICLLAFLAASPCAFGQQPAIDIQLAPVIEGKTSYGFGEPVSFKVMVTNTGQSAILINQGFMETDFSLEMRIVDPLQRPVGAVMVEPPEEAPREVPDAPPQPMLYRDGKFIPVMPYESVAIGWTKTSTLANLLDRYPLQLAGQYSAQVRVSVMTFKPEDAGNIKNYQWQGTLTSNTFSFSIQGTTKVDVSPSTWNLSWQALPVNSQYLSVVIWPPAGYTASDYNLASIRLNDDSVILRRALRMISSQGKPYILAYFDKHTAVASLGSNAAAGQYSATVYGKLAPTGELFSGRATITLAP